MYLVYLLKCDNLTYIGMTNNFLRRWRQHIGDLKGGARYTKKKKDWYPILIIDGFETMKEAMQCEWKLKRARGYLNRIKFIDYIFNNEEKFTKNGSEIKSLNLKIYSKKDYYKYFNNLELRELYWIN